MIRHASHRISQAVVADIDHDIQIITTIETIPVGPLGLVPLKSCTELGKKVNDYLVTWRRERESEHKSTIAFAGYQRDSYIIDAKTPRFGSGEAKGIIQFCSQIIDDQKIAVQNILVHVLHFLFRIVVEFILGKYIK